jgi:cyanate lyase
MSFSKGKSKSSGQSGQTSTQRHASNILFETLIPGSSMTGGYVSDQSTPAQRLARESSVGGGPRLNVENMPGGYNDAVRDSMGGGSKGSVSRKMGNYVPSARQEGFGALKGHGMTEAFKQQIGNYTDVQGKGMVASANPLTQAQTDDVTKTLLPSMEDMRYKGTFERLDKGLLPDSAADVIRAGRDIAADPMGQARQQAGLIDQAVNNGEIPQLPELPEIDQYLTDVYTKMPEPMKKVVEDIFNGGTSANIEKSIQNNITALTANAESVLKDQLDVTYGKFASSGVSGGAMLAAAGDVTTKVMADVTAQVAGFYTNALTQAQQQQQLAFQTLDRVIGTAEAQQAMDAQRQAIDMEAQVNLINAKLGMYTELTNQFLAQNQVYSGIIAQEIDRENTEQINSMRMFYEIMVSLATGGPALSNQRSKSSNFSISGPSTNAAGKYVNPLGP